jgi:peptide/nickel transport system substrate-binding protein
MVSSGTEEIMLNVFEGLLMPNSKGELTPAIAESYKISEDGRRIRRSYWRSALHLS